MQSTPRDTSVCYMTNNPGQVYLAFKHLSFLCIKGSNIKKIKTVIFNCIWKKLKFHYSKVLSLC